MSSQSLKPQRPALGVGLCFCFCFRLCSAGTTTDATLFGDGNSRSCGSIAFVVCGVRLRSTRPPRRGRSIHPLHSIGTRAAYALMGTHVFGDGFFRLFQPVPPSTYAATALGFPPQPATASKQGHSSSSSSSSSSTAAFRQHAVAVSSSSSSIDRVSLLRRLVN